MTGTFQCSTVKEATSVVSIMKATIKVFSLYVPHHPNTKNNCIIVVVNNIFIQYLMQDFSLIQYLLLPQ